MEPLRVNETLPRPQAGKLNKALKWLGWAAVAPPTLVLLPSLSPLFGISHPLWFLDALIMLPVSLAILAAVLIVCLLALWYRQFRLSLVGVAVVAATVGLWGLGLAYSNYLTMGSFAIVAKCAAPLVLRIHSLKASIGSVPSRSAADEDAKGHWPLGLPDLEYMANPKNELKYLRCPEATWAVRLLIVYGFGDYNELLYIDTENHDRCKPSHKVHAVRRIGAWAYTTAWD
jgi:hypothetical protein